MPGSVSDSFKTRARGCDAMPPMLSPDLDAAERFLAAHGRVLDRRRFERLFRDGEPDFVRDAVAAHRNPDGGFGHALEPDGRSPGSQPAAMAIALRVLHEADAWDAELLAGALDWLECNAPAEGGATFVDPSIDGWPHAPWWVPEDGLRAALYSTGQIAAVLHARGVDHPWLARATELMFERIAAARDAQAYELIGATRFLDAAPDRARARDALDGLAPALHAQVTLDPDAPGEVHGILDFAPQPQSLARALFDDATVQRHLDPLAAGQREDGGWTFNWPAWSPAAEADWRGSLTVDALLMLRLNGP
jgi:hypothetical protein